MVQPGLRPEPSKLETRVQIPLGALLADNLFEIWEIS